MHKTAIAMIVAVAGVGVASSAWARTTTDEMTTHRMVHRHHVAHYQNPKTTSDVPQETAAPEVKPDVEPETFYHAVGSDGSH